MAQGEFADAMNGNRFLGAAALSAQPFACCGRDPYVDVPPLHRVVTFLDELASQAAGRSAAAV
jgi:hypothetical protein